MFKYNKKRFKVNNKIFELLTLKDKPPKTHVIYQGKYLTHLRQSDHQVHEFELDNESYKIIINNKDKVMEITKVFVDEVELQIDHLQSERKWNKPLYLICMIIVFSGLFFIQLILSKLPTPYLFGFIVIDLLAFIYLIRVSLIQFKEAYPSPHSTFLKSNFL